ncbi:MAG: ssDNA-binding domain-containing protein [Oscillospiraceae bacterium]|nr:ssDNA-binding domain-containing protein [Oscillospiraceae bacterium]
METTDNVNAQQPPKKNNKERLKDITASIETGIKDLFESDKYKQYLQGMRRFHRYSGNNQVIIHMQNPNATHVARFNKWRDQFSRNVKKGEKGIKIIAPTPYKKKVEETKLDPDTKLPLFDDNGKPITEEKEIQVPMFRVVSVFDVGQTVGKPLPQLASDISGNVENYDALVEAIKRTSTVPIKFEALAENTDGYFSTDKQEIVIRDNMSEVQTVSALLHEMAHSKLHNTKAKEEKLQEVELFGEKALFSNERIKSVDIPDGLYRYDLRGSDDDPGIPCAIEEHVGVNHAGCVITSEPIDIAEIGYIPIQDELNFLGSEKGMREFLSEQHPDKAKLSRNDEEVQAESVSYSVCAFFGIKNR